jgi:hypothetical protein
MISRLLAFAALSLTGSCGTCAVLCCAVCCVPSARTWTAASIAAAWTAEGTAAGSTAPATDPPLTSMFSFACSCRGLSGRPPFLCLRDGKVSMPGRQAAGNLVWCGRESYASTSSPTALLSPRVPPFAASAPITKQWSVFSTRQTCLRWQQQSVHDARRGALAQTGTDAGPPTSPAHGRWRIRSIGRGQSTPQGSHSIARHGRE